MADVSTAYAGDMAHVHQDGYSDVARMAAPAVVAHLRAAGVGHGLVVDVGCGTGVLTRVLTDAGYDVLGVDLSADMLALARETAPAATYLCGSFVDVDVPRCDAVVAVGQTFGYAVDPRSGPAEFTRLLDRIAAALRPGGALIFDVNLPGALDTAGPGQHVRDTPDWTMVADVDVDLDAGTFTRHLTLFRRVGDGYRRSDEQHVVRTYDAAWVLQALAEAGLQARRLDAYGPLRFDDSLGGFLAIKPV